MKIQVLTIINKYSSRNPLKTTRKAATSHPPPSACVSSNQQERKLAKSWPAKALSLCVCVSRFGMSHGAVFFFLDQESRSDWTGAHLTLLFLLVVRELFFFFFIAVAFFSAPEWAESASHFRRNFRNAYRFLIEDWRKEENRQQVADWAGERFISSRVFFFPYF